MFRRVVIVVTIILASGAALGAQTTPASTPASHTMSHGKGKAATGMTTDQAFVKEAAIGGMAEVDLGQLASTKATNDKVKAFAQRMVMDHGKANDELKTLASSKNMSVPAMVDAKHKATHDRLDKLSGTAFDRAYVADMLADHRKDAAAFKREATSATDNDVKQFAAKTLPTLEEHLTMVEDLSKDVGATAAMSKTTPAQTKKAKTQE
jgi:putative membrane protein